MIELVAQWARSAIFTAAFCAVVLALTPEGRVRKATELVCALVCIFAVLSPIIKIDFSEYSQSLSRYRTDAERLTAQAEDESENLNRLYIEDKCAAYILDKAKLLGAKIESCAVELAWSRDGCWYPVSASICGTYTAQQKQMLSDCIEAELGISCAEQKWEGELVE